MTSESADLSGPDPSSRTGDRSGIDHASIFEPEQLSRFLGSTELFGQLESEKRQELVGVMRLVSVEGGQTLFGEGDPPDAIYVVHRGRLRAVVHSADGDAVTVGEIGRGDCVGEMAVITGEPRSASIVALRDSVLLRFDSEQLLQFLRLHPRAALSLASVATRRARSTADQKIAPISVVAVQPLDDDPGVARFAERLEQALRDICPTVRICREVFEEEVGVGAADAKPGDALFTSGVTHLHHTEERLRFVVLQADARPTPWTRRCLRQSDRVLLIARACSDPRSARDRLNLSGLLGGIDVELMLLHEANTDFPSGTARWLDMLPSVVRHHHVRVDIADHVARVARILTNRALGLVCGGGGARGFAHAGVFQAFHEHQIPVDLIGGTSMGSIFAAAHAQGWSVERMADKVRELFSVRRALIDPTFPYTSLLSGFKMKRIMEALYEDRLIEDCWYSFFCVSVGLRDAEVRVHRRGPLRVAIRASCSLPGIFPPVHVDRELLVDGGVMNNLPVDIMRAATKGGPIVAVDVSGQGPEDNFDDSYSSELSGWRALFDHWIPWREKRLVPRIFEVLMRSTVVASREFQGRVRSGDLIDLLIEPPVSGFGVMDYRSFEAIMQIGREHATERLKFWERPHTACEIDRGY